MTAAAFLLVGAGLVRLVLYVGIGLATPVATAAGVVLHRPRRALPWWLLAAGLLSNVVGDVLVHSSGGVAEAQLLPNVADVFYLACYPLFAGGLLLLIRSRVPGRDRSGLVDALIMATGAALLAWVFLVSPHLRAPALDLIARLASVAYPLGDLLILAVAVRLAMSPGARPIAYRLLGAAVVALVATDVGYLALDLAEGYEIGGSLDAGWIVAYGFAGAAVLHPSMAQLAAPAQAPAPVLRRRRMVVLAGVLLLTPALLVVDLASRPPGDLLVIAAGSALLSVLVAIRMAGLVGALARALTEQRHQARHDVLTGLANRELFLDRVEQALLRNRRLPGQVALLFIDLDDFKQINDTLGHAAGDRLLNEVAARLRTCLRAGDLAARLGGDEFAILLDGVPDPGLGAVVARRVLAAVGEPLDLHGARVTVEASIGIATTVSALDQAGTLLRRADVAMYAAKGGGKGRYSWFDPATHADEAGDAHQAVGTGPPPGHAARPSQAVDVAGPLADPRWPNVGAILGQVSAHAARPQAAAPGPGGSAVRAFASSVAERMQAGEAAPGRAGDQARRLAQVQADRAALAIERTRLLEAEARALAAAERTFDRLSRLQAVTAASSRDLTPAEVAEVAVRQGVAALDALGGLLALVDMDALEVVATLGHQPELVERWHRLPLTGVTPLSAAVRRSVPIFLGSPAARQRCMPGWRPMTAEAQAWAAVPLAVNDRCLGVLGLTFAEPRAFAEEDRLFLVALAGHCGQALERARLHEAERVARRAARAEELARRAAMVLDPTSASDR